MHIAIFGLSGSGKTSLTNQLTSLHPKYYGTSASKLLKEEGRPVELNSLETKGLSQNQDLLIMAYEKLKAKHTNTIVEFHAVIETNTSEFWVETTLLKQIKADVIFFIHACPSEILRRRMNDKSKQRKITTTEKISELQTKAVDHLIEAYGKEHVIILDEQYAAESITSKIL
ncbi:AAA family ATPase [Pseudomonas kielensis]|uniref:AAA family ATPase n=1 Tax=Pseudomonas kielensis TaxID=2762577 RepID=A0A7X1GDW0_9PSED|nr:AAA family ATPase [Pseudomonas kielensis]MBC2689793.1 AAA family ATPase [Pseudomonas kielensis]